MTHPDLNVDHARAWLDALPGYEPRHGLCALVGWDAERTGWVHCAVGVAAETVRAAGGPLEVRVVPTYDGPVLDYVHADTGLNDPYAVLTGWLGINPYLLRVRLDVLPGWLAGRVAAAIEADRLLRPCIADWWDRDAPAGHPVWRLSDARVPFDVLADALRVVLDVDPERVPGTAAHALCVAQEAAEGAPWGDGTPETAQAVSAAGAR